MHIIMERLGTIYCLCMNVLLLKSLLELGWLDHVQEDTDTMVQELESWRAENDKHRDSLRREER